MPRELSMALVVKSLMSSDEDDDRMYQRYAASKMMRHILQEPASQRSSLS